MIDENKLTISHSPVYSNEEITRILNNYIKEDKLGLNPMLNLDGDAFQEYEKDKLKEFLLKLNIINIELVSKEDCAKIWGYRGRDGMIIVNTK